MEASLVHANNNYLSLNYSFYLLFFLQTYLFKISEKIQSEFSLVGKT